MLLSHKLKWKLRSATCIRMGIQATILCVTQDAWQPFVKGAGTLHLLVYSVAWWCLKNYCLQDTRSLCGLKAERKSCEAWVHF
jgi:hypothetical protein